MDREEVRRAEDGIRRFIEARERVKGKFAWLSGGSRGDGGGGAPAGLGADGMEAQPPDVGAAGRTGSVAAGGMGAAPVDSADNGAEADGGIHAIAGALPSMEGVSMAGGIGAGDALAEGGHGGAGTAAAGAVGSAPGGAVHADMPEIGDMDMPARPMAGDVALPDAPAQDGPVRDVPVPGDGDAGQREMRKRMKREAKPGEPPAYVRARNAWPDRWEEPAQPDGEALARYAADPVAARGFREISRPIAPMATEHLFEIPWNCDPELITRIASSPYREKVKFVYIACRRDHGECTRYENKWTLLDKEHFEGAVAHVKECGFEPCVLAQRRFDPDDLPYYHGLGIRHFTVGEDKVAVALRERYGDSVYITASITKDLMADDFQMYAEEHPGLYDIFILRHGYSRDIQGIMELPKSLKYGIMPGLPCLWDCPIYRKHWFPWEGSPGRLKDTDCMALRKDPDKTMYINANDLWLFDPYVTSYKMVGRTEATDIILSNFMMYCSAPVADRPDEKDGTFARYNIGHGVQHRMGDPIY